MKLRRKPGGCYEYERNYTASDYYPDITGVHKISARQEEFFCNEPSPLWQGYDCIRYAFAGFGSSGAENQHLTDFHVEVEWEDVLEAVKRFAEHGSTEAKALQAVLEAIKAAAACDNPPHP